MRNECDADPYCADLFGTFGDQKKVMGNLGFESRCWRDGDAVNEASWRATA